MAQHTVTQHWEIKLDKFQELTSKSTKTGKLQTGSGRDPAT